MKGAAAEEAAGGGEEREGEEEKGGVAGLPYMAVDELSANIGLRGAASRLWRQSVVASRV